MAIFQNMALSIKKCFLEESRGENKSKSEVNQFSFVTEHNLSFIPQGFSAVSLGSIGKASPHNDKRTHFRGQIIHIWKTCIFETGRKTETK